MTEPTGSRLSKAALVAFVLGVSSLLLSLLAALPALFFGLWAVRAINMSDAQLGGRRLAIAGIAVAGFTTLATVVGFTAWVLLSLQDKSYLAGCTNNLRQIGVAINAYNDLHGGNFPTATVPNPSLPPPRRLSWQAAILPLLSRDTKAGQKWAKLASEIAFEDAWDAPANAGPRRTNVAPFLCPAFTRGFSDGQPGLTAYVGITGVGLDAATLPKEDPQAGFFGYDRTITRLDISAGISFTMTAIETTRDNGPWLAGGNPTTRGLDPSCEQYLGYRQPLGGLHRGGANVLWVDGSVNLVEEGIDPDTFRARARIHRSADQ
jgi:prepilin-type processing-associated H-X9-DG protein